MSNLFDLAREILFMPGIALRLGMMIGAALILGFLLYDGYRVWLSLFITGSVFLAFEEWMRMVILERLDLNATATPVVFAVVTSLIFAASIGSGMYLSHTAKKERRIKLRKAEKILSNIKENGGQKMNKEACNKPV